MTDRFGAYRTRSCARRSRTTRAKSGASSRTRSGRDSRLFPAARGHLSWRGSTYSNQCPRRGRRLLGLGTCTGRSSIDEAGACQRRQETSKNRLQSDRDNGPLEGPLRRCLWEPVPRHRSAATITPTRRRSTLPRDLSSDTERRAYTTVILDSSPFSFVIPAE